MDDSMDTELDCGTTCSSVFSDDWFVMQEVKKRLARALVRIQQLEKRLELSNDTAFLERHFDKLLCDAIRSNKIDDMRSILEHPEFLPEYALNALSLAYINENYCVVQELLLFKTIRDHVNSRPDLDMTRLIEVAKSDRYNTVVLKSVRMFHQNPVLAESFYGNHHRSLTVNRYPNNLEGNRESLQEAVQSRVLNLGCINI